MHAVSSLVLIATPPTPLSRLSSPHGPPYGPCRASALHISGHADSVRRSVLDQLVAILLADVVCLRLVAFPGALARPAGQLRPAHEGQPAGAPGTPCCLLQTLWTCTSEITDSMQGSSSNVCSPANVICASQHHSQCILKCEKDQTQQAASAHAAILRHLDLGVSGKTVHGRQSSGHNRHACAAGPASALCASSACPVCTFHTRPGGPSVGPCGESGWHAI